MFRGFITILCFSFFGGCQKTDFGSCNTEEALYQNANFPIGTAVSPIEIESNEEYANIVKTQFNGITPENAFKMDALQVIEGVFSFSEADSIVAFADRHRMRLHGHALVWHNQLPAWINNYSGSKSDWILILEKHVKTVVGHFGNTVTSWDVVNEAFEDDGSLRKNIWFENIGEDYIELAFKFANEVNKDALLFYNDYNIAQKTKKCEAIVEYLRVLRSKGIRIDGIGMQMHIHLSYPSNAKIGSAFNAISEADFLVHISEIDISLNTSGEMRLTENKLQKQGEKMFDVVSAYRNIPKEYQFGITVWGVSDADSWITTYFDRIDYPLLFNEQYEAKPMYCGFKEALAN